MARAKNFLNYALRVFILILALPVSSVTLVAAISCGLAAADGSLLKGILAGLCAACIWGFIGTLAAAQSAIAMGASRIIAHVAPGERIREILPNDDSAELKITTDEFREAIRSNETQLVRRPEDSRPASIIGTYLLRTMQKIAVWSVERVVRVRFTERSAGKLVINCRRLADSVTQGLDELIVSYVRRKAIVVTVILCIGGVILSYAVTWGISMLPL